MEIHISKHAKYCHSFCHKQCSLRTNCLFKGQAKVEVEWVLPYSPITQPQCNPAKI